MFFQRILHSISDIVNIENIPSEFTEGIPKEGVTHKPPKIPQRESGKKKEEEKEEQQPETAPSETQIIVQISSPPAMEKMHEKVYIFLKFYKVLE